MGDEEQKSVPKFVAPVIQDNVNGWGPCDMPEQFKDMPYQPFSKGDRLGKASVNERYSLENLLQRGSKFLLYE